jgi:hypothetical protein
VPKLGARARESPICRQNANFGTPQVDTFRWGLEQRREIDALEFTRGGDQVVLGARGPNIGPEEEPLGQIFNVFTLRDGRIVRIGDYRGRSEALEAAGVAEVGWR